jgi:hypothetical protein
LQAFKIPSPESVFFRKKCIRNAYLLLQIADML